MRHNLFGNHNRNTLKNYSWLKNIFLLYNNDDSQLAYIKKGGNLDDLLCDSTSVIFTTDGVVTALNHSNFSEIIKLISNSSTFDILVDGIIGKKEFYPTIERLASAIVNEENRTDAMKSISRMINIYYSLPDIIMNSTTVKPFYSIIEAPRPTIYKIVSKLPMSVTEIPFNMITYDQFIDIVKHLKIYVPINTRDDNSELVGIDKYLSIADIVKLIKYGSEGYLCNINKPSVGFTVLNILELDV